MSSLVLVSVSLKLKKTVLVKVSEKIIPIPHLYYELLPFSLVIGNSEDAWVYSDLNCFYYAYCIGLMAIKHSLSRWYKYPKVGVIYYLPQINFWSIFAEKKPIKTKK